MADIARLPPPSTGASKRKMERERQLGVLEPATDDWRGHAGAGSLR